MAISIDGIQIDMDKHLVHIFLDFYGIFWQSMGMVGSIF